MIFDCSTLFIMPDFRLSNQSAQYVCFLATKQNNQAVTFL
ncbi:hypothetical protein PTUN_a4251 [Pseudoalteromonas tunicata]|nr:hypothetical protein PTUN_a4251 [Pseudoalteromonas tunicata]